MSEGDLTKFKRTPRSSSRSKQSVNTSASADDLPLPKSVLVGPYFYDIERFTKNQGDVSGLFGYCNNEIQRIEVSESLTDQCLADTLLHENLHAIFYVSGLRENKEILEHEEAIVSQLSSGLIAFMRANPDFMPYLKQLLDRDRR
jgi:hypothetical protein